MRNPSRTMKKKSSVRNIRALFRKDNPVYKKIAANISYLGENLSTGGHRYEVHVEDNDFLEAAGVEWVICKIKRRNLHNAVEFFLGTLLYVARTDGRDAKAEEDSLRTMLNAIKGLPGHKSNPAA